MLTGWGGRTPADRSNCTPLFKKPPLYTVRVTPLTNQSTPLTGVFSERLGVLMRGEGPGRESAPNRPSTARMVWLRTAVHTARPPPGGAAQPAAGPQAQNPAACTCSGVSGGGGGGGGGAGGGGAGGGAEGAIPQQQHPPCSSRCLVAAAEHVAWFGAVKRARRQEFRRRYSGCCLDHHGA